MNHQIQKINRSLIIGWFSIVIILVSAYVVEVFKNERTLNYLLNFMGVVIIPAVIALVLYLRKPDWEKLCYYIVIGYSIMYIFVMYTGNTPMVFSYILALLSFLVLYHKPKLIIITGAATVVVNILTLIKQWQAGEITISNSKDIEIRFACLIVCFVGSYVSARLYDEITKENEKYTEELAAKNQEIQDMAIQTIVTIANTIDAKDEYTRGHSRRVAEYASAVAEELGLHSDEIRKIRSIALLHDIGKIGVPDAVLNKPGKLTNDEYELMKQHTVMGAEILKDIGMLPGIDIGAKHHHERYDGKGYPDGLAGEQIPIIARIIAVADAFDAMTSNRIYREHLDMEYVMKELKKCKGTQFDPGADEALIRLLEEGKLEPLSHEQAESEQVDAMSKIWSRVLEKGEEKFKDKSVYDELTGLYNRSQGEKLIREQMGMHKGCLLVVDVDHFRRINGEAGFLLGDIFLRTVANALNSLEVEKVIARYGGDEFVVFVQEVTDKAKITELIEGLNKNIKQQADSLNAEVSLTISTGIRICENNSENYQDAFLDADRALYFSKQQGGNCYRFFEKRIVEIVKDQEMSASVDLVRLSESVKYPEKYNAYMVESEDFQQAHELLKGLLEESERPLQLILFSLTANGNVNASLETQNEVTGFLEKAIARSIKGRDYTFRYSSMQRMVLLTDAEVSGANAVSTHIMKEFYKIYDKREFSVSYSMIGIS